MLFKLEDIDVEWLGRVRGSFELDDGDLFAQPPD